MIHWVDQKSQDGTISSPGFSLTYTKITPHQSELMRHHSTLCLKTKNKKPGYFVVFKIPLLMLQSESYHLNLTYRERLESLQEFGI